MKSDLKSKNLKSSCNTINKLFNTPSFFIILCSSSNNNLEQVIKNLSLIINYYLVTNDSVYTYSITELLLRAEKTPLTSDYLIHPSNSLYESTYKRSGLNNLTLLSDYRNIDLESLEHQISFSTTESDTYFLSITKDICEAISSSFNSPRIVYKSILKQPRGKELPLVVGTDEVSYYKSILSVRLNNLYKGEDKTATKKAKRIIKKYIGKDSLLVIINPTSKKHPVSEEDISKGHLTDIVSSRDISFIRIPSKYKLISICAQNKGLLNGTLLDINKGEDYQVQTSEEIPESIISYSRFEKVPITDKFIYINTELSGDINYDIDLIYGALDTNRSRTQALCDPFSNMESIKHRPDIHVRKINDGYQIRNGRHRILYTKYFYVTNYDYYKSINSLSRLKEIVTIPMSVEYTIDNETVNTYLKKIIDLGHKVSFLKADINKNDLALLIILKNRVYIVKNEGELIDLYNLLSNNELINDYIVGINNNEFEINFSDLFDYLIVTLQEKLYTMNIIDIIDYLKEYGFYQNGTYYNIDSFNYYSLYYEYIDFQHILQRRRVFNQDINIIEETEQHILEKEVGLKIMDLINANPELLNLDWEILCDILIQLEEFRFYSKEFLERSANTMGYTSLKIMKYYGTDSNAKLKFL